MSEWIPVDCFTAFGGYEEMWLTRGEPIAYYRCSECKEEVGGMLDDTWRYELPKYCPCCGGFTLKNYIFKRGNRRPVKDRKKGKWISACDGYDEDVKCNRCFKIYDFDEDAWRFNFCPNCGASVRQEKEAGRKNEKQRVVNICSA